MSPQNLFIVIISLALMASCSAKKGSERFVTIKRQAQHIRDLGSGHPAVVFINGFGDDLNSYDSIQRAISSVTRTISYDRAGLGKSQLTTANRSLDTLVFELHEILRKEDIAGPYVLVGHSYGGHIARYFAYVYPKEVGGIILIDPGTELLDTEFRKVKTPAEIKSYDSLFENGRDPEWSQGVNREADYFRLNEDMLREKEIKFQENIPVTLITAMNMPESSLSFLKGSSQMKIELHKKWAVDFPHMRHVLAQRSGHYIHYDEPQLVIDEIKAIIQKSNSQHSHSRL